MSKLMLAVRDEKVNSFGTPFCTTTKGEGIRMVMDASNDPNTLLNRHPQDFSLYKVGTFDEISGEIIPENQPMFICRVDSLKSFEVVQDAEIEA